MYNICGFTNTCIISSSSYCFQGIISVSGTSVLVSEPNFVWIPAIPTDLWPLKWTFKMAAATILDFFSELKCQVSTKRPACISTSTLNLVKMPQRGAELWRFMCFQNSGRSPSWIFAEVKFGGISVSGTSALVSEPNVVRIRAIATELWPFKWIFKMAAVRHLELLFGYSGPPTKLSC